MPTTADHARHLEESADRVRAVPTRGKPPSYHGTTAYNDLADEMKVLRTIRDAVHIDHHDTLDRLADRLDYVSSAVGDAPTLLGAAWWKSSVTSVADDVEKAAALVRHHALDVASQRLWRARAEQRAALAATREATLADQAEHDTSETVLAERSGVDRMTIRKWLGK